MTAFDWDAHNATLDRKLAEWNAAERELSECHIEFFSSTAAMIKELAA